MNIIDLSNEFPYINKNSFEIREAFNINASHKTSEESEPSCPHFWQPLPDYYLVVRCLKCNNFGKITAIKT
jgi:hypothetical protein